MSSLPLSVPTQMYDPFEYKHPTSSSRVHSLIIFEDLQSIRASLF